MNLFLWIVQIALALVFLLTGVLKVFRYDVARQKLGFVQDSPRPLVTLIGALEILGALGIILPTATGILPWLTPLAAVGLGLLMIGASAFHVRRGEYKSLTTTITILVLAAVLVYGRGVALPL